MTKPHIIKTVIVTMLITTIAFLLINNNLKTCKTKEKEIPTSPQLKKTIKKYDRFIDSTLTKNKTIGAAIAIIHNNRIEYLKCYGLKKSKTKDTINEHTVFRLASVSKAVSGVLAGMLINEDKIHLNDLVIDYLPTFELKEESSTNLLDLEHLLTHTTGLVPHAYDNLVEDNVSFLRIIENLKTVKITAPPGKLYGYQNVTYSLIDTIFELATKTPFEQLIEENVFTPFCMQDASTNFKSMEGSDNVAYPHHKKLFGFKQLNLNKGYYNTIPAAGINASITDMANFVKCILNSKENYTNLTDTIFKPRIKTPLRRSYFKSWDKIDTKDYGLGWRIITYKNRKIAYHGGYIKGYKTEIAICEDEQIGIVYLSNSPDKSASVSIPTFFNMYLKQMNTN